MSNEVPLQLGLRWSPHITKPYGQCGVGGGSNFWCWVQICLKTKLPMSSEGWWRRRVCEFWRRFHVCLKPKFPMSGGGGRYSNFYCWVQNMPKNQIPHVQWVGGGGCWTQLLGSHVLFRIHRPTHQLAGTIKGNYSRVWLAYDVFQTCKIYIPSSRQLLLQLT